MGVFSAVVSFAVSNPANYYAFLVIPWVSLILGWTYVVNDEKISAIGRYIRFTLVEKIKDKTNYSDIESIFGWKIAHRSDDLRKRRKIQQLIIDEIAFVLSGIIAIVSFYSSVHPAALSINILAIIELILLIVLGVEIVIYADLGKGR